VLSEIEHAHREAVEDKSEDEEQAFERSVSRVRATLLAAASV